MKSVERLSTLDIETISKPGRHADGHNLYLKVSKTGQKSWTFMWRSDSRQYEIGLGSATGAKRAGIVTLATARRKAREIQQQIGSGINPADERRRRRAEAVTFGTCAREFIAAKRAKWSEHHTQQWERAFEVHAKALDKKRVGAISVDDVLAVLRPLWGEKRVTADRVRNRIEQVINYAISKGHRSAQNPAIWKGRLEHVLAGKGKTDAVQHLAAMPYKDVPEFMGRLASTDRLGARALEFAILTAARSGEVYGAAWSEIDLEQKLWIVPPARMKRGREHVVPLTDKVIALLEGLPRIEGDDRLFPGRDGGALNKRAMEYVLKDFTDAYTVHGFRSSFRDFAGDETMAERDIVEMALAHKIKDATEAAYRRGSALKKRRTLMETWEGFLYPAEQGNKVVTLRGA